ncbi:hypothetical protein PFISCL1PPCAC_17575, partial [Pristionchus fissidentatus]
LQVMPRHRSRSRSKERDRRDKKDRKRERSRDRSDRDRNRDRERDRERDRKRERSRDRSDRKRSRSTDRKRPRKEEKRVEKKKEKEVVAKAPAKVEEEEEERDPLAELLGTDDKEEQDTELEKQMEERRKKVEEWRKRKAAKAGVVDAPVEGVVEVKMEGEPVEGEEKKEDEKPEKKGWSLEDDDDDDLIEGANKTSIDTAETNGSTEKVVEVAKVEEKKMDVEEEEDELDAYMSGIKKELVPKTVGGVRMVTLSGPAAPEKQKGEVLENEDNHEMLVDDFDMEAATNSLLAKGRLLPQTDHNKVYYRKFRKNFYNEVPDISNMTKREVEDYRYEMDQIKVRGKDVPRPIKSWPQCGAHRSILSLLKKQNYQEPTPIQKQAIPAIMSGRDVIGIAKTGSGKTLAFLIPMFRHIRDQDELDELDGPIAIIMSPTRELAMQTWKEANKLARPFDLRVVCVYGGVGISEQIADLKRGAEIVVCTPGRMIDMLAANNGKVTNLRRCTYLVLDEADRMFDMGFEPQVMKIVNNIRPDRQTVLFSATFPRTMEALAKTILDSPIEIEVGGKSVVCDDVTQNAMIIEEHQKFLKLLELLGKYYEDGRSIIFVDRQEKADEIMGQLMASGYMSCATLHGGIDQFDRDSSISDFKEGTIRVLVATSVAARGLDVKELILVVNYDCPNHYEDYVHRVGRTGRAGNKGFAYTFILPEHQEKMAGEICKAFETAGATPPADLQEMFNKFKAEMEAMGKQVKLGGRGFEGSGYKYDDNEADNAASQRKMAKLLMGVENGLEDDDDEMEDQLNSLMRSKTRVVDASTAGLKDEPRMSKSVEVKVDEARNRAQQVASKIASAAAGNVEKKSNVALATEAIMRGTEPVNIQRTAADIARARAAQISEGLTQVASDGPVVTHAAQEEMQYFEEELDINDFPQQVRYRICSRDVVSQICDLAEVGMSIKGTHYPPGKEPKEGDRRLTILLEARDERQLKRAKDEILRIMKETIRQLASQNNRGGPQGRYKVF